METELEQAIERVRARKAYVNDAYQAASAIQRQMLALRTRQGEYRGPNHPSCNGIILSVAKQFFKTSWISKETQAIMLVQMNRDVASNTEASPSSLFPQSTSQSNLHSLAGRMSLLGASRGLNIYDMALERSGAHYEDQKKAKGEANTGFASSSGSGAAAEGTAETFTGQSEPAHGSSSASNWQISHQAHHRAQAYSTAQFPTGYFSHV